MSAPSSVPVSFNVAVTTAALSPIIRHLKSLIVADFGNNKIRRITTAGRVYTIAGTGAYGGTNSTGNAQASPSASSGGESDILKRLLRRREQQLGTQKSEQKNPGEDGPNEKR